jgi:2'-5' RNA ligase
VAEREWQAAMRLFIALWPSEAVAEALAEMQGVLRRRAPGGVLRLTRPEQLHVTLRFLGEVPEAQWKELCGILRNTLATEAGFNLCLSGAGAFPSPDRPRVIWAGLKGDDGRAIELQSRVAVAVAPFASHTEDRAFHPHITLARVREASGRDQREVGRALRSIRVPSLEAWGVTAVRLMRSQLSPEGARYSTILEIPLLSTT